MWLQDFAGVTHCVCVRLLVEALQAVAVAVELPGNSVSL